MTNPREINREQFETARRFWLLSNIIKLFSYIFGFWSIIWPQQMWYYPICILVAAIAAEVTLIYSDYAKSKAENLLKLLDLKDSFGRPISATDIRDVAIKLPLGKRESYSWEDVNGSYFASPTDYGPKKAVENLLESAWYTRNQVAVIVNIYIAIILLSLLISLFVVTICIREINDIATIDKVIKLLSSSLLSLLSLNLTKGAISYYKLHYRAKSTESNCEFILKQNVTYDDAMKQWSDYQAVRAVSPLLPNWLWKIMGQKLKDRWTSYLIKLNEPQQ